MYPAVEEQGLIGTFSAALVADDGTIDWFCAPRFGSLSIFASFVRRGGGSHGMTVV
jgi:hypothetical protein